MRNRKCPRSRPREAAPALSTAHVALLLLVALFTGCTPYARVVERRPHYVPSLPAEAELTPCATAIAHAKKCERDEPLAAIAEYLRVLDITTRRLARKPGDEAALNAGNFALARIVGVLDEEKLDAWTQPLRLPDGRTLSTRVGFKSRVDPRQVYLRPSDQYQLSGAYVGQRTIKHGLGAPVVATAKFEDATQFDKFAPGKKVFYGLTAVAHCDRAGCVISFEDPLAKETVIVGGRQFELAADFTAPLALALAAEKFSLLEIERYLWPAKYAESARLARLQPYDPEKIPVICVHGLISSPASWTPMINTLRGDPEIRRRYQFWYYGYPSGYPYPLSAAIFRKQLDAIGAEHPGHKPAILIGHSMGGVISRLMITDSGNKIWNDTFSKPPAELIVSSKGRELLESSLIFEHRRDVGRVIFICAPHRGADLAANWIGRLGSRLIQAPKTLLDLTAEVRRFITPATGVLQFKGAPNSIDSLSPNNRFVKMINTLPFAKGIPYHSIIGDRGRGDSPNSSDGVVAYWSSHLPGAESERIVPANHSAQVTAPAIAEVARILKQRH
jgi:pimeloyl-ACP methyl ester carboxylesterase